METCQPCLSWSLHTVGLTQPVRLASAFSSSPVVLHCIHCAGNGTDLIYQVTHAVMSTRGACPCCQRQAGNLPADLQMFPRASLYKHPCMGGHVAGHALLAGQPLLELTPGTLFWHNLFGLCFVLLLL